MNERSHRDYSVAWICALPLEAAAAVAMLDEQHESLPQPRTDHNIYTLGRVGRHNVAIACLGRTGANSAATVASQMLSTFTNIRFGLMVGIGGGAPSHQNDIRLGDVVVSKPSAGNGGVIQYDFGKTMEEGKFIQAPALTPPPPILMNARAALETRHRVHGDGIPDRLSRMRKPVTGDYTYQGAENDMLFQARYNHIGDDTCHSCDHKELVAREKRTSQNPLIHYGVIASANQVMRDGITRDKLARELGVLCFEMEAAGLAHDFPCIVIRGISDYADSHKNKQWKEYAAATATAYAHELLSIIPQVLPEWDRAEAEATSRQRKIPLSPYFMVPYQENKLFVGRDELLSRLFDLLCQNKEYENNHRVALFGLGGVGKTQTAIKYIYTRRNYYRSIFWISAVNQGTLFTGFRKILRLMQPDRAIPDSEPAQAARLVIAWLENQTSWLLVIDNLDDITVINGYLPANCDKKHTLITTRNPNAENIPAQGLEVGLMSLQDATKFFLIRGGFDPDSEPHAIDAAKVVEELGYLPLAIEQAAAYTRVSKIKIDKFLSMYLESQENRRLLLQETEPYGGRRYNYTVATTWKVSFDLIIKDTKYGGHIASTLLQLFAFLNPDGILVDFLKHGAEVLPDDIRNVIANDIRLNGALKLLQRFSLITIISEPRSIAIHRLVQEVIQHEFEQGTVLRDEMANSDLMTIRIIIVNLCNRSFPQNWTSENRDLCRSYVGQVMRPLLDVNVARTEQSASIMYRVSSFLREDGKFSDSERLSLQAVEIRTEILGVKHPDTLNAMHNLAKTYWSQGKLEEARAVEEEVLQESRRTLGDDYPDTLKTMHTLASMYWSQGKLEEAKRLQEEVLQKRRQTLGEDHPDTLGTMHNLASTYWSQGKLEEARALEEEVLRESRRTLGDDHWDTLRAMQGLAITYQDQGKLEEARALEEEVLQEYRQTLRDDHPDTLGIMHNLATTYWSQGKLEEARGLQEEVLQESRRTLGDDHPGTLMTMHSLAITYWSQGKLEEARRLQEEVLQERRRTLGDDHPDTLGTMHSLANTYWSQGKLEEARRLQEEVLQEYRRALRDDHPATLMAMNNLALTYRAQGRTAEAAELQERALEKSRCILGDDHPDTLTAMSNLAATYRAQGKAEEVARLQEKVLQERRRTLGDDHAQPGDHVLEPRQAGGGPGPGGRGAAGEAADAGDDHADTPRTMHSLASTYWSLNPNNGDNNMVPSSKNPNMS